MKTLKIYMADFFLRGICGPDSLAAKANVSRSTVFRAKNGNDLRMSQVQKLVDAVGAPLILTPKSTHACEDTHAQS
ncbi:MAG: hypothetical protein LBV80_08085 [Deltaproteobacteria bacterium]|jgi:predicted transcriptional regulator|nr:hypothetical protein [Deltaproteobacteria bacterium]